jgi:hypothetical protein
MRGMLFVRNSILSRESSLTNKENTVAKQDEGWKRKDVWKKCSRHFTVEVTRHTEDVRDGDGPNRWCVYAYIYPTHPRFGHFSGDSMYQSAACALPLHGGPSLLTWHVSKDGKVGSVQVGADYHHIHDTDYTFYDNAEQAGSVFFDANALYEFLADVE